MLLSHNVLILLTIIQTFSKDFFFFWESNVCGKKINKFDQIKIKVLITNEIISNNLRETNDGRRKSFFLKQFI